MITNNSTFIRNLLNSARNYSSKRNYSIDSNIIKIPARVSRGPTDILRTLARTHKKDINAPHYKYHDDPYLIPYSNFNKRSYALSLEAGRKAAQWIRQEHADLFNHSVSDPHIELFIPSKIYEENTEVSLDDLRSCISNFNVVDAITVYNNLEKQSIDVDVESKQALLELLCYYNAEDGVDEEWLEERWFRATHKKKDIKRKTWKDNGIAEKVFFSIKPPTSLAYTTIISGMAKYGQVEGAMKLFNEANSKNIPLGISVYNSLIAKVNVLRESHDMMWTLAMDLISAVRLRNLEPTLETFNALLETISFISSHRNSRKYALQVLAEMKQANIDPSLASFFHILIIYYGGNNQNSGILHDIMDYLEGKSFEVRDINDGMFFVTAMEMCRHKLHEVSLGYKINELLNNQENYNLIGDSFRESQYYRYFFSLLCEGEPIEEFMKIYDKLVPHLYTPEPSVMMEVLNSVEVNLGYKFIPKIWTDITLFDLSERQILLIKILELMNQSNDEVLQKQFVHIGWSIWEKLENQTRERNVIEWTVGMLSDLLKLLIVNKELAKANLVFDKLYKNQNNLAGEPSMEVINLYVHICIETQSPEFAIKCVRYCKDMGFGEAEEFCALIEDKLLLNEIQKQRLHSIFGKIA